ncbi:MAG: hypothetical protein ACKO3N_02435, partial [Verrucomicrobiota bacterium]
MATAVSGASLTLRASGNDGLWDTADDVPWTGEVEWVAAERTLVLRLPELILSGKFRATLAAGLVDAAGNGRPRPLVWEFAVGDPPVVTRVFPPSNFVRVGGTLDELVFNYNQPVASTLLDTFAWTVVYRAVLPPDGNFGPPVTVSPIQVLRSPDRRSVSLRTTGNFAPGYYLVSGQGPFLNPVRWEFYFRDVPNEAVGVNPWAGALWKHPPGVGVDDELVINLPGEVVPVPVNQVRSVLAYTEARLEGQRVELPTVLRFLGGLQVYGTTFGSGVTEVSGPVFLGGGLFSPIRVGSHVLNLRGGGVSPATVEMFDAAGVIANHPGSRLVLTNEATFRGAEGSAGRFLNAGTLHSAAPEGWVRFEEVPLQNPGRLEVAAGTLRVGNLQHEGVAEVAPGAILRLAGRSRSGLTSTFTGAGALEFGELLPGTPRVQTSADAELRGGVEVRGPIRLWSGTVTLARPWVRPEGGLELRNSSVLRLQAPARLGGVTVGEGRGETAGESEIGALVVESAAELRAAGRLRVTGEARLAQGLRAFG